MSTSPVAPAVAASLQLRRVAIDTYRENVAYLHRDCAVYRAEGFQALSKVEVRANGRRILASLNVVDDDCIVGVDELGLSEDAFAQLGVANGHPASISQAEPAGSIPALHRKIAGERLNREDFRRIVRDIAEHRYSKIELTAFVVACNQGELDREEVYFLSDAMADVGRRLDPFQVGVGAETVVEGRALQAVAVGHFDGIDAGLVEGASDGLDLVEAVLVADRMAAITQGDVGDIQLLAVHGAFLRRSAAIAPCARRWPARRKS